MDMVNIKHAKKAQALASDLDYRKKLHEYTVLPEDMKTQWAKKAYGLQSEVSPTHCQFPPCISCNWAQLYFQSDFEPVYESITSHGGRTAGDVLGPGRVGGEVGMQRWLRQRRLEDGGLGLRAMVKVTMCWACA